jgi:hypothetical protein
VVVRLGLGIAQMAVAMTSNESISCAHSQYTGSHACQAGGVGVVNSRMFWRNAVSGAARTLFGAGGRWGMSR